MSCTHEIIWRSFCSNVGWLYTHLVAAYSGRLDAFSRIESEDSMDTVVARDAQGENNRSSRHVTESTALLLPTKVNSSVQTFMAMYAHLWFFLLRGLDSDDC